MTHSVDYLKCVNQYSVSTYIMPCYKRKTLRVQSYCEENLYIGTLRSSQETKKRTILCSKDRINMSFEQGHCLSLNDTRKRNSSSLKTAPESQK